jgi:hypothetical protein
LGKKKMVTPKPRELESYVKIKVNRDHKNDIITTYKVRIL